MASDVHTHFSTILNLSKREKLANDRLLFGRAVAGGKSGKTIFKDAEIFGFVRWRSDIFGTQTWRVIVAQAGVPGEKLTRIPGVEPGAHLLLHAFGKVRAKRALRAIDVLSDSHILHEIHRSYWRYVHVQIAKNLPVEPYDREAFAALERASLVK